MKKNELINKTLAGLMIAAMTAGVCPTTAFAVTGETIAADNTYTKTVKVEPDEKGGNSKHMMFRYLSQLKMESSQI